MNWRRILSSRFVVVPATIALIVDAAITVALGVRDSILFEGIRPILIECCALLFVGLALLAVTYIRAKGSSPGKAASP